NARFTQMRSDVDQLARASPNPCGARGPRASGESLATFGERRQVKLGEQVSMEGLCGGRRANRAARAAHGTRLIAMPKNSRPPRRCSRRHAGARAVGSDAGRTRWRGVPGTMSSEPLLVAGMVCILFTSVVKPVYSTPSPDVPRRDG